MSEKRSEPIDTKAGYYADAGALRIDTPDAFFHIINSVGDGSFDVEIVEKLDSNTERNGGWRFKTVVGVKTTATVSGYDCGDEPVLTLSRGRWAAFEKDGDFRLVRWDGDV